MDNKFLTYRGDVKAAVGIRGTVLFTTVHPEGQPTALYRLDVDKLQMATEALPCGGACMVTDGDTVWVGGTDGRVYAAPVGGGAAPTRGQPFASAPVSLALLSNDRIAALVGSEIAVVGRKDGKVKQTLALPEAGTCL
ncbi:MAG: hypothetical protein HYS12_11070, partial [Planctomycetes bacterium]|nr:hypothetical protein [Planctomycetota bacterium]